MSVKLVKVINNKDRYFNGARKGGVLEVDENRINYYLQNGFSLVKEVETKNNIVKSNEEKLEDKEFYQNKLDHLGIKYNKNFGAKKLNELLKEAEVKKDETSGGDNSDIETLKTQLVEQAIVTVDELEGKSNDEITQIATDNGLI